MPARSEPCDPGSGSDRTAGLPAASAIVPPAVDRAPEPTYARWSASSPRCTAYANSSSASPSVPSTYAALRAGTVERASVGVPDT